MSFRWKMFLIFLACSLVPVAVVSFINRGVTERTSVVISDSAAEAMQDVVRDDIIQMASNLAGTIGSNKNTLLFTVDVLAERLQQALSKPPARAPEAVFSLEDFRNPARAPEDMTEDAVYAPSHGAGAARVSRSHPVFFYAEESRALGQPDGVYPADVRALAATAPFLRRILDAFPNVVYRVYVSLENGLYCSLPGHAGYPPDYDPRTRVWYRRAVDTGEPVWSMPLQDAPTRRLTLTASAPIRDVSGRIIGVAGLDVLDSVAMRGQQITDRWGDDARTFLVYPDQNPGTGGMDLRIAASQPPQAPVASGESEAALNDQDVRHPWLDGLAPEDKAALLRHLQTLHPGAMEVRYDGEEYLLAYSSLETIHFLVLVPQAAFMNLPNQVQQALGGIMDFNLLASGAVSLLVVAVVLALLGLGTRYLTAPLIKISDAVRRLGEGDFSVHLDLQLKDKRGNQLVKALNEMGPKLEDHLRLRHALAVAEEVQRNFLPKRAPQFQRFDVQGASIYCDETGGDYYDYIPFKEGEQPTTAVLVGDVSGHGVPSALLMATARALLRCLCAVPGQGLSLAQRVGLVNSLLCSDVAGTGRFMTLFLLELDDADDRVRWVRAGHDPALLYDPAADTFEHLEGDGMVMGVLADYEYRSYEATLDTPGLVLAMGTDGIWEARNAAGEMFGKDRFQEAVRAHAHKNAAAIFEAVIDTLVEFMDGAAFEDDVTLVVVKRRQT